MLPRPPVPGYIPQSGPPEESSHSHTPAPYGLPLFFEKNEFTGCSNEKKISAFVKTICPDFITVKYNTAILWGAPPGAAARHKNDLFRWPDGSDLL